MWIVKFGILFHPYIFSRLQESRHHCPSDCSQDRHFQNFKLISFNFIWSSLFVMKSCFYGNDIFTFLLGFAERLSIKYTFRVKCALKVTLLRDLYVDVHAQLQLLANRQYARMCELLQFYFGIQMTVNGVL